MVATAVAYLAVVFALLALRGFDASSFVIAGDAFTDPSLAPPGLSVAEASDGYDGQFYYRLATSPASTAERSSGVRFDFPAYRQQRIAYPAIVWLLSAGQRALVPWVMILVNLVAVAALGWAAARYLADRGEHGLWALGVSLSPSLLLSVTADLTEPLEVALLVAGLTALRRGRAGPATGAFSFAVFARETALVLPLAAGAAKLWARLRRTGSSRPNWPWYVAAVPVTLYAVWFGLLTLIWHQTPAAGGRHNFGFPFLALGRFAADSVRSHTAADLVHLAEIALLGAIAASVVATWRSSAAGMVEKLGWAAYALMLSMLSANTWGPDDRAFMRVATEFAVLGLLIVCSSKRRIRPPLTGAVLAVWVGLAIRAVVAG